MKIILSSLLLISTALFSQATLAQQPPPNPGCQSGTPPDGEPVPVDGDVPCSVVLCGNNNLESVTIEVPAGTHDTMAPINYYYPMWLNLDMNSTAGSSGGFVSKEVLRMTGGISGSIGEHKNIVLARVISRHDGLNYHLDFYLMNPDFYTTTFPFGTPDPEILVGTVNVGLIADVEVFEVKIKNNKELFVIRAWDDFANYTQMTKFSLDYPASVSKITNVKAHINAVSNQCPSFPRQPYYFSNDSAHSGHTIYQVHYE